MEVNRRSVLVGTAWALLAGRTPKATARSALTGLARARHPLTVSLLDRAQHTAPGPDMIDHQAIESGLRRMARVARRADPLVIKWLANPEEALDYLDRFGLDALLSMTNTNFSSVPGSMRPFDEKAFNRAEDAHSLAAVILRVEEQDLALMAPKLAAKAAAIAADASAPELFAVRAKLAQIGWLETSWAAAAAEAVFEVEYALCRGEPEQSESIRHQLTLFEAYEAGLLATWETPEVLICVRRRSRGVSSSPSGSDDV
jgi:hypothetical protein